MAPLVSTTSEVLSVTDSPGASPSNSGNGISTMPKILAGLVAGSVGLLLLIIVLIVVLYWRRRRRQVRRSQHEAITNMNFVFGIPIRSHSYTHEPLNNISNTLHNRNPRSPIMIEKRSLDDFDIKGGLIKKISSIPEKGTFFVSLGGGLPSPQRPEPIFDLKHPKR